MIKLLIVDDEETIRKGLGEFVPWNKYDFEVAGIKKNGLDALDFFDSSYADIVISDLKMPLMDGIELMQRVHEIYPQIPFIFISGYDTFQYVQKALNNGAFAYILKPINIDELLELLKKACEKCSLYGGDTVLKNLLTRNFFIKNENWDFSGYEYIKNKYSDNYFCVVNIRYISKTNTSLFDFHQTIKNALNKGFNEENYVPIDFSYLGTTYCVFNNEVDKVKESITKFINYLCQIDSDNQTFSFRIYTGGIYKGIYNIVDSYVESFNTDACKGMSNNNYDDDLIAKLTANDDEIVSILLIGNINVAINKLKELKENMINSNLSLSEARQYLRNLLRKYITSLKEINIDIDVSSKFEFFNINFFNTIDEIFESVIDNIKNILSSTTKIRSSQTDFHIAKVKRYVEDNYSDPYLSLMSISDIVGLNPSYLSTEFTKNVGISFINYLTDVRIENAKIQLFNTGNKITDVSNNVGYINCTYFCTLFKKKTGMTPSEFRAIHNSN